MNILFLTTTFTILISQCLSTTSNQKDINSGVSSETHCSFTLPQDPSINMPLFLTSSRKLLYPTFKLTFNVQNEDVVYVDCEDSFKQYKCQDGQLNASDGSSIKIKDYSCKNKIKIYENSQSLEIVNIGFETMFAGRRNLYTTHIDRSVRVNYTKHIITNGGYTQLAKTTDFVDSVYLLGDHYNDKYNAINLKDFVPAIHLEEKLMMGQFTPSSDFNLWIHQSVTYIHSNVAPQWKSLNRKWKLLETHIRNNLKGTTATIYTGTIGDLMLKNSARGNVALFVYPPDKIPVPLWFYKIVIVDDKCVVYLGYNYPKTKKNQVFTEQTPCTDIYSGVRNETNKLFNFEKNGYILCCDIKDLQKLIGDDEIKELNCTSF